MITFQGLRKVQLAEKKGKLSKLPPNFFLDVADYLKDSEGRERENAQHVFESILESREQAVLSMAFGVVQGEEIKRENFTAMEGELFERVVESLRGHRAKVLNRENHRKEETRVKFLEDFPRFSGEDREYGPFKAGDVEGIPPVNAEILKKKRIVEYEDTPKG